MTGVLWLKVPADLFEKTLNLGRRALEHRVRDLEQLLPLMPAENRAVVQDLVQVAKLTLDAYGQAAELTLARSTRLDPGVSEVERAAAGGEKLN